MAQSACYPAPQPHHDRHGDPTHEWYRPDVGEANTLDADLAEHVRKGGLLLREIAS